MTNVLGSRFYHLLLILAVSTFSCNQSPDSHQPPDGEDGDNECILVGGCDGHYAPEVIFEFVIADTGEPYCGPAEISYSGEINNENYGPYQDSCICIDGEMRSQHYDYFPCHVNSWGHVSITVVVEGYETFTTEVDMPCECHPQIPVRVELTPL